MITDMGVGSRTQINKISIIIKGIQNTECLIIKHRLKIADCETKLQTNMIKKKTYKYIIIIIV